jgi:transposase-like protein
MNNETIVLSDIARVLRGPCVADHPVTMANTQRVGDAGFRCRECRRKIARDSARRRSARSSSLTSEARI